MNPLLLQLAIQLAPEAIDLIKKAFAKMNPADPAPTDAEVIAAFNVAFVSSLARDDQWLAEHPQ